jgi:hypothetical protein
MPVSIAVIRSRRQVSSAISSVVMTCAASAAGPSGCPAGAWRRWSNSCAGVRVFGRV